MSSPISSYVSSYIVFLLYDLQSYKDLNKDRHSSYSLYDLNTPCNTKERLITLQMERERAQFVEKHNSLVVQVNTLRDRVAGVTKQRDEFLQVRSMNGKTYLGDFQTNFYASITKKLLPCRIKNTSYGSTIVYWLTTSTFRVGSDTRTVAPMKTVRPRPTRRQ